jgi:hypothetical protein
MVYSPRVFRKVCMERWTPPLEEPREERRPPPRPPSQVFGKRHRPPHEVMFDGLEHVSAQLEKLELELARIRELLEQRNSG